MKFSNNLKIVSRKKRAYVSTAIYPSSFWIIRQPYRIAPDIYGLQPWASGISNRESETGALSHILVDSIIIENHH